MSLAPAAARDGFWFAGDLYAEASGHNRHRRAAVSELKEHFKSGSDKDHPAHWFEAQLIHYGLQPSKTKSVARMRLFDAVNAGKLAVPSHIQKLEKDLKKEWTKNEREAKQAVKSGGGATSSATARKRKVDSSNVDMNISVGGINITVSANGASTSASAAKKAKTSTTGRASSKVAKDSPKSKSKPTSKPTKKTPKTKASAASKTKPTTSTSTSPAKKQTARRGGTSQGPSRGSTSRTEATTSGPYRTKQTARRGGAVTAGSRIPGPGHFNSDGGFDEPPPPYQEYDDYDDSDHSNHSHGYSDSDRHSDSDDGGGPPPPSSLGPLGLLNGRYDIFSREANAQWGFDDFDLVLTISGRQLWGSFDLGVVSGILHFDERPWESSDDRVRFTWRGSERDGPIIYGDNNGGWIRFLGDGFIEGELDYMRLDFKGERLSGQGTRSQVDAYSMQREWNEYTEEEYERLNRARW
ncbi:hypothetical protein F5Y03DRAFT_94131 [Xylaria venustula]|nr:hypothetical protein F5Y03DRAFT_94131 [Xylaria venustula]